jgi:hypothetical protein
MIIKKNNKIKYIFLVFFILLLTSLNPNTIEKADNYYIYKFGLFNFLELRSNELIIGNIFYVIAGSANYFIPIGNLLACLFVITMCSILAVKIFEA